MTSKRDEDDADGFSIASQIAGVGLGTSLSMCVIVVLGVIFPALINGLPGGPPAALVSVGVILGVAGFLLMGYACILREKGRAEASTNARNINDVGMEEDLANAACAPQTSAVSARQTLSLPALFYPQVPMQLDPQLAVVAASPATHMMSTLHFPQQQLQGVVPPSMMMYSVAGTHFGNGDDNENAAKPTGVKDGAAANNLGVAEGWSPLSAVVLCLVAGLLSACLQLAFVLGVSPLPLNPKVYTLTTAGLLPSVCHLTTKSQILNPKLETLDPKPQILPRSL